MDHKLTGTGYERGGTAPSLLGQLGEYCLSPRVLTKVWKLLGGEWGWLGVTAGWAGGAGGLLFRAVASRLH